MRASLAAGKRGDHQRAGRRLRPSQILDNIKAVENTGFTAEELAEIDRLSV